MTWWNRYVGIPYATKGRDRSGVDCWGLVRLIHEEVFRRKLPSFAGEYADGQDRSAIEEAIAVQREGWARVDQPAAGDVVLFNVMGHPVHVGVSIGEGKFIHAREGYSVTVERLDSGTWRHRVEGFYRYQTKAEKVKAEEVEVVAIPHPLKAKRIEVRLKAGMTLAEIAKAVEFSGQVPAGIPHDHIFMLDGKPIPAELLETTVTQVGQRVEYRAVPRGGIAKSLILLVVVVVAAWYVAPFLMGYGAGAAGWAAASAAGATLTTALAAGAIGMAGMMLVGAIFPIRPPTPEGISTDQVERGYSLQGGQNRASPYQAIPVVLGQMRFTPPVGAVPYNESTTTTNYLRMLLVWGFGQLQITDLRVGSTPLDTYEGVMYATQQGSTWEYALGHPAIIENIYGPETSQDLINIKQVMGTWTERIIKDPCDRVTVTIHFPEGLRLMQLEGDDGGNSYPTPYRGDIQIRRVDSATFAPLEEWANQETRFYGGAASLGTAWTSYTVYAESGDSTVTQPMFQWSRLSLDKYNNLIVRPGALLFDPNAEPSGPSLDAQAMTAGPNSSTYFRLPAIPDSEIPLWDVCVYGDNVYQVVDARPSGTVTVSGGGISMSGLYANVAAATITRVAGQSLSLGLAGEDYSMYRDAFSVNVSFQVPLGCYEVRMRRNTTNDKETTRGGKKAMRYHDSYIMAITGHENRRPIAEPPGTRLAVTALRIKATDQLNGSLEGITGTVISVAPDYDHASGTWPERPTRNPASLMRLVLQHQANVKRVPDSGLDLPMLADFHNFCRLNGFTYDNVVTSQKSVLDLLRDICAAGRASPTLRDGKWTVVIDRPRSTVAQHFTPHNSWGFEGTRLLPKLPHGFRVRFMNAEKGYQADEMIVYNDGYSAANATLFEGLELPGVTVPRAVYKHARFHLAQLRLRSESYTLNADMEHLVCTRGDLVRVTHDVPMWGRLTGRVSRRLSATQFVLDEPFYPEAGKAYTIRFRSKTGASVTRSLVVDYAGPSPNHIQVTASTTAAEADAGDLFMLGDLNQESVELIVHSIEPSDNMSARIKLVDYAPGIYDSDVLPIPPFNSQITRPSVMKPRYITEKPTITHLISDESVLEVIGPRQYQYGLRVVYTNPLDLPINVARVEAQYDLQNDGIVTWTAGPSAPLSAGSVTLRGVEEGKAYRVRLRYIADSGLTGPWVEAGPHTVVGKTTPPGPVVGLAVVAEQTRLRLSWDKNGEPDLVGYEVRRADSGWGTPGEVFRGEATSCYAVPTQLGANPFYVKAIDAAGNYSTAAAVVSYVAVAPTNVTGLAAEYQDTSTTSATVTLRWGESTSIFGIDRYEVELVLPNGTSRTTKTPSREWITAANWIGNATLKVTAIDGINSPSATATAVLTKSAPNAPASFTVTPQQTSVMLAWAPSVKTTLPVAGYEVRAADSAWGTDGFLWRGAATSAQLSGLVLGLNTWYVRAFDTDSNYSPTALAMTYTVAAPTKPTVLDTTFADTSNTIATVTLRWSESTSPFGVKHYLVTKGADAAVIVAGTTWTTSANWTGDKTFQVVAVDYMGNQSAVAAAVVTKQLPNPPTGLRADVVDNNVLLYWTIPPTTTLPITGFEIRRGATWASAEVLGRKDGAFTTLFETSGGTYTYWLASIDSDGQYSTPVSLAATVSQPADYVLFADINSALGGTLSNAVKSQGAVFMPVAAAETFQQHFSTRGWASPQAQVSAGYPIYVQPAQGSGYYEETIDYGTVLAGTRITVTPTGEAIGGTPTLTTRISHSLDGTTYTDNDGVSSVFATNFRYIKVRVTVGSPDNKALYKLSALNVRLDAKNISDAGIAACNSADVGGTTVNFVASFIDVTSLTATPMGSTAVTAVVDFADVPNPTSFKVLLFNPMTGARVSGNVSWAAKGH